MDLRALAQVTVLDLEGRRTRLGAQWERRPAVIVWLRHFGCLFCREQAWEMRALLPEIHEFGADLVLVGNGGVRAAHWFHDRFAPDVTVLTDPELRSYRLIGAHRSVLRTIGPAAWTAGIRALRSGARQTSVKGHPFQQGAVMVMLPGGRAAFVHLSRSAGDHPRTEEIIETLRQAQQHAA